MEQASNTRRNRFVTINGETRHLAEWCRIAGVNEATLHQRIEYGWADDRLLEPPQERDRSNLTSEGKRLIVIDGKSRCVTEWAAMAGLQPHTVLSRLKRGWTGNHLLSPTRSKKGHKLTIGGETRYVSEWANSAGLPRRTLHYRISKGWPADKLLLPLRNPRDRKVITNGR